jgi:hypothetical protein
MGLNALYQDIAVAREQLQLVLRELAARHRIDAGDLDHAVEHVDELLIDLLVQKVKREIELEMKPENER